MNKYFVYVDCKPDGMPFYVGKGNISRINDKRRRNNHHSRICAKYPGWYRGLAFMGNEQDAFAKEIELIEKYKSIVVNQTDGGQGSSGLPRTSEWKNKISLSVKSKLATLETKQKMVDGLKKAHNLPETKAKMQAIGKSRDLSKFHAKYICIECGHITNSRWLNSHLKLTNHAGKALL
jgi:hypothetical protein